ncbi:MAG: SET domain-containing protein [Myxococcota bacterium]
MRVIRRTAHSMFNSFLASGLRGVEIPEKGGHGVFAEQPIPRGRLLVVFGGDVIDRQEVDQLAPGLRPLVLQVDEDAFLVSTKPGPADWVNHSCDPNAGLRGQICLVAMRDIAPGEEITFDYAMSDGCDYDEFLCGCRAARCRGRITGDDWSRPDLVERYRGFRSPYLDVRLESRQAARRVVGLSAAGGGVVHAIR